LTKQADMNACFCIAQSGCGSRTNAWSLATIFAMAVMGMNSASPVTCRAAIINYGDHAGSTVMYSNVAEEGAVLPLLGAPILSSDSLDFNPAGFDAVASGAGGSQSVSARLTFTVSAKPGYAVSQLFVQQAGHATLAGSGSDDTAASVIANGTVTIGEVDGAAITPIVTPVVVTFNPSGGSYDLLSDGGGGPVFHTLWSGALQINLDQILTTDAVPFSLGVTGVSVDLVSALSAASEAGTSAETHFSDFGIVPITVPEPAAHLGAVAVSVLLTWRRRPLKHRDLPHLCVRDSYSRSGSDL
jgi:hypothetical protein